MKNEEIVQVEIENQFSVSVSKQNVLIQKYWKSTVYILCIIGLIAAIFAVTYYFVPKVEFFEPYNDSNDNLQPEIKKILLVDTDGGPDDILAISLLLSSGLPNNNVVTNEYSNVTGYTTVFGDENLDNATYLVLSVITTGIPELELYSNIKDSKVFKGAQIYLPEGNYFSFMSYPVNYSSLSPPSFGAEVENATSFLQTISKTSNNITLITLGPLTNIAQTILQSNEFAKNIKRMIIMGGAIDVPGNVPETNYTAEYNICGDPYAANVTFSSGIPIVLIPLDTTSQVTSCSPESFAVLTQPRATLPLSRVMQDAITVFSFLFNCIVY